MSTCRDEANILCPDDRQIGIFARALVPNRRFSHGGIPAEQLLLCIS
jgi:hypothetical protein